MVIDAKAKGRLKKLRQVVKGAKSAYILIYSNPDPDSLASAWALKEILQGWGVSSTIGYTGQVGRLENAAMIESLKLPAECLSWEKLREADRVAIVDAQPGFFQDLELPRCDIVIDHHPKISERKMEFCDIRPRLLSTCTMMTEYWVATGRPIPQRLATALLYGIETDTQGQQRSPGPIDRAATTYLEGKANRNLLRRIEFAHYSLNDLDYFSIALIKRRYARNVIFAHLGPVPYSDVCVQVADFLIRVQEAHWALVTGVVERRLIIVFRSDGIKKNAGKLAQLTFGNVGSAGGHPTMGRAEIVEKNLPKEVRLTQSESLERYVVSTLAKVNPAFRPLMRKFRLEGIAQSPLEIEH
jgi:nanoRNase/pAp phosphatase (c-di-AMP/oligoRNAs hydrolase)